jgi:hypothetical protein
MSIQQVINYVNQFIPKNYTIISFKEQHKTLLYDFIKEEKDCHDAKISPPGLLIFNNLNDELMAYIAYSINITNETREDLEHEQFLGIDLSCTGIKYRRKQLSTYLRIVLFLYAIQNNIKYIASDVNPSSQSLLKKFHFKGDIGNYLEEFNWIYSSRVNTNNTKFKKAVNDFFRNKKIKPEQKKKTIRKKSY